MQKVMHKSLTLNDILWWEIFENCLNLFLVPNKMTSPVIRIGYLPYIVFEGPILPHKELSSSSTKYATTTVPCSKIGSLLSKIKVWAKGLYFQKTSRSKYWIYGSVLSPDFGSKVRTKSKIRNFQRTTSLHPLSFMKWHFSCCQSY